MADPMFNGIFNTLVIGIPAWAWIALVLVIVIAFSNALWWLLFWSPLKPLQGLWYANWNKADSALILDIDNNMKLISEYIGKLIFNETPAEAKKNEVDWREITSGQMGTVGTDIIADLGKWTVRNTEIRYILEEAADEWNINNPEDQIHSLSKLAKYIEEGKITVPIETTTIIPWIRIESAFPKNRKKASYAGYIRQLAEKMDKAEKTKMDSIALYIVIGGVVISALFVISKFLMK